jgi:NAD(P)-dependent dehydrogenase (short-subunit alcohol dehydrogenase family)
MSGRSEGHGDAGTALVIGAQGGIGGALAAALEAEGRWRRVIGLSRRGDPPLDITEEASVEAVAARVAEEAPDLALVIVATGFLHDSRFGPEKGWKQLDAAHMAKAFAVNAIGPALLMKHLLPRLRRDGPALFAALSARVGSIGDNRLGGWTSYRASTAALNMIVRNVAIEWGRTRPGAIVVAVHPGTVDTALSRPFGGERKGRPPAVAAADILRVVDALAQADSGTFVAYDGARLPW